MKRCLHRMESNIKGRKISTTCAPLFIIVKAGTRAPREMKERDYRYGNVNLVEVIISLSLKLHVLSPWKTHPSDSFYYNLSTAKVKMPLVLCNARNNSNNVQSLDIIFFNHIQRNRSIFDKTLTLPNQCSQHTRAEVRFVTNTR